MTDTVAMRMGMKIFWDNHKTVVFFDCMVVPKR